MISMKKTQKIAALLLSLIILAASLPMSVSASPSSPSISVLIEEEGPVVTGIDYVHRLVFSVRGTGAMNLFAISMSFDSNVIVPAVPTTGHPNVSGFMENPVSSFALRFTGMPGIPTIQLPVTPIGAVAAAGTGANEGRVGFHIGAMAMPGAHIPIELNNTAYEYMFKFYFRVNGDLDNNSFRLERSNGTHVFGGTIVTSVGVAANVGGTIFVDNTDNPGSNIQLNPGDVRLVFGEGFTGIDIHELSWQDNIYNITQNDVAATAEILSPPNWVDGVAHDGLVNVRVSLDGTPNADGNFTINISSPGLIVFYEPDAITFDNFTMPDYADFSFFMPNYDVVLSLSFDFEQMLIIPTSVVIDPSGDSILQGGNQVFMAQVLNQFDVPYSNQDVIWSLAAGTANSVSPDTSVAEGYVRIADDQRVGTLYLTATSVAKSEIYETIEILVVSAPHFPVITGPNYLTLIENYSETYTEEFTISGYPLPTVKQDNTHGGSIVWNDAYNRIDITEGLAVGIYQIILTADNGILPNAAHTFILTVSEAPAPAEITEHPSDQSVTEGETATFTVVATGYPTPSFRWQIYTSDGWDELYDETSATLTLLAVDLTQDGTQYRVLVWNDKDDVLVSDVAVLTVNEALFAPEITEHPSNQSVTEGETAVFVVEAIGTPVISFQWQISTDGGNNWRNIEPHETDAALTLTDVRLSDNGNRYRVVVANNEGTVYSDYALLSVYAAPAAPEFTLHPINADVVMGETATFTVAASGNPAPTIHWQVSTDDGTTWADIPLAIGETLTLTGVLLGDSGNQYRAVAVNSEAPAGINSYSAALTVNPIPTAPQIILQPLSISVVEGEDAAFVVDAVGYPVPSFQWEIWDEVMGWVEIDGETASVLSFSNVQANQSGDQFRAVVHNGVSPNATSDEVSLTVEVISIITSANYYTVQAGTGGIFRLTATGTSPMTFFLSGTYPTGVSISGSDLIIAPTVAANIYSFSITASNLAGNSAPQSFMLMVTPEYKAPVFISHPSNESRSVGETVAFDVSVSGYPVPTLQWQVSTDGGGTWNNLDDDSNHSGITTNTLTITDVVIEQNGYLFRAVAENHVASTPSNPAELTVSLQPEAPSFTSPGHLTVASVMGDLLLLTAEGDSPISFTLDAAAPYGVTIESGNVLTITDAVSAGTHVFTITATNPVGSDLQEFTLTVPVFNVLVSGAVRSFTPNVPTTLTFIRDDEPDQVFTLTPVGGIGQRDQDFSVSVETGIYTLVVTKGGHLSFTIHNIVVRGAGIDLRLDARLNQFGGFLALIAGDVNMDGRIDNFDALIITSIMTGNTPADAYYPDILGNGIIDRSVLDIVRGNANRAPIIIP
jgi:hypothetical protein